MTVPERFRVLASLPPQGEFRRDLALDPRGGARAVVLAYAPQALSDDPARLAALVRDVEAAARLHHPGAATVLGTETVGDALVVVEAFRAGASVRALLDASGRLPPDVAARIAVDVASALGRAHAIETGDGQRLAHGALDPARVIVGDDGAAFVAGLGISGAGAEPPGDVRALGAVLFECLSGEPAGAQPRKLDAPGVPPPLADAVDRATGAAGEPFASAAAFAEAVAAAAPLASQLAVAAYVEAMLSPDEGERAELRRSLESALGPLQGPAAGAGPSLPPPEAVRPVVAEAVRPATAEAEEVSADLIVEPTDPGVVAPRAPGGPSAAPSRGAAPVRADAVGTFPKPALPARSRLPLVAGLATLAVGLAGGFVAGRAPGSVGLVQRLMAAIPEPPPVAGATPPAEGEARATDRAGEASAPARSPRPPAPAPDAAAADAPRKQGAPPARHHPATKSAKRGAQRSGGAVPASTAAGAGLLTITAPADAEIFLDGRPLGKGSRRLEIPAGDHRVEARLGTARVAERFSLAPGETWTYDITPQ